MPNTDYIPNADADRVSWINNAATKLPAYQTVLGLTTADTTQLAKDSAMYAYTVNLLNIIKQTQQNATAFKNLLKHESAGQVLGGIPAMPVLPVAPPAVPAGIFDRTRSLMQRAKNSAGYTDAIGQDLNIVASINTVDLTSITPELKGKLDVGRPHLKWQKGYADAIDLFADHNDGAGFVLIGRFLRSEYLDITPLAVGKVAEEYKYKAVYVINDEQVGIMSQVFSITALRS
jgi:hypothetical protein